jgi:Domain of unknown function (DUF4150)
MSNQVYANNMEVSCKKAAGKSICAFPDVCFTPPQTPATPPGVPIPYPNTGMASDCTSGSSTVKISGQEVMLKNKSYFKKSMGDEAGCAPKKGVVTSKNTGKVYFTAWSMDVKVEGENVVRHFDLTTHNHASQGPNTPPMIHIDEIAIAMPESCRGTVENFQSKCSPSNGSYQVTRGAPTKKKPTGAIQQVDSCSDDCRKAQKCLLIPKKYDKQWCCPEAEGPLEPGDTLRTGHHLIEDQWVKQNPNFPWYSTNRGAAPAATQIPPAAPGRNAAADPPSAGVDDAPTVCANTARTPGTPHRELHDVQGVFVEQFRTGGPRAKSGQPSNGFNYGQAKQSAVLAHTAAFPDSECSQGCIEDQLDTFYGADNDRPMNLPTNQQGLGDNRQALHDTWGGINQSASQSLGDLLKHIKFG